MNDMPTENRGKEAARSDYEIVSEHLNALAGIDGELQYKGEVESMEDEDEFIAVELWRIGGKAVILLHYENNKIGLYQFVGEPDASVSADIEFLNTIPLEGEDEIDEVG